MKRRTYLWFVLLVVLAVFYATVSRDRISEIAARQKAQTQRLNHLDEEVLDRQNTGMSGSGK